MSSLVTINLAVGVKAKIAKDTLDAIRRAIPIYDDDRRVISYACAAHERITPDIVAAIRRTMLSRGELTSRAFSRRYESMARALT